VLPRNAAHAQIERATEVAIKIAWGTSTRPLRDGNNVLHTLIEVRCSFLFCLLF
jgi:hypothetical protein